MVTVEQIVDVPVLQDQEQTVEVVEFIPQAPVEQMANMPVLGCVSERIVEQLGEVPVLSRTCLFPRPRACRQRASQNSWNNVQGSLWKLFSSTTRADRGRVFCAAAGGGCRGDQGVPCGILKVSRDGEAGFDHPARAHV